MALVKVKPTSPGRRALVKVVNANLHKGKPVAALIEKQSKRAGRNNSGHITTRHQGGGHKQHYRIVDFRSQQGRHRGQGRAPRIRPEPQRQSRVAVLCRRRAPLRDRAQGCDGGAGTDQWLGSADQERATRCRCEISRSAPPSIASKCCRARARNWRVQRERRCSCSRAKAFMPSCACVPAKFARCTSIAAPRSVKSATKNTIWNRSARPAVCAGAACVPTVRGVAMNPIDHPHGGGEGKTAAGRDPVSPWGTPTKGYKTRRNKRTRSMIVRDRHGK